MNHQGTKNTRFHLCLGVFVVIARESLPHQES
jgi:hypothetical protein